MYCSPAPAPPWPWLRGGYVVNDNKDVQAFGRIKPSYLGFVFSLSCFVLLLCFFIGPMSIMFIIHTIEERTKLYFFLFAGHPSRQNHCSKNRQDTDFSADLS
jgi:hypothetical protein